MTTMTTTLLTPAIAATSVRLTALEALPALVVAPAAPAVRVSPDVHAAPALAGALFPQACGAQGGWPFGATGMPVARDRGRYGMAPAVRPSVIRLSAPKSSATAVIVFGDASGPRPWRPPV